MRVRALLATICCAIAFLLGQIVWPRNSPRPAEGKASHYQQEPSPSRDSATIERTPQDAVPIARTTAVEKGGAHTVGTAPVGIEDSGRSVESGEEVDSPAQDNSRKIATVSVITPAERQEFVSQVLPTLEAEIPLLAQEIADRERDKLPAEAIGLVRELADSEMAYRFELAAAVREEILRGDVSSNQSPSPERRGVAGVIDAGVARSEVWPHTGKAKVSYFIEFARYKRVAAAAAALSEVRRRVREAKQGR